MNFSPENYTFDDFKKTVNDVLKNITFIDMNQTHCLIEDSVPWINIISNNRLTPKQSLKILEQLQAHIVDEIFH